MTSKMLLEQYMAERHALGFSLKTDEGCIQRFLRDFAEPDDGVISFTKEYVLSHMGNRLNVQTNTILRDVSAINGFLDFVIRKGYTAYKIPPKCAIGFSSSDYSAWERREDPYCATYETDCRTATQLLC